MSLTIEQKISSYLTNPTVSTADKLAVLGNPEIQQLGTQNNGRTHVQRSHTEDWIADFIKNPDHGGKPRSIEDYLRDPKRSPEEKAAFMQLPAVKEIGAKKQTTAPDGQKIANADNWKKIIPHVDAKTVPATSLPASFTGNVFADGDVFDASDNFVKAKPDSINGGVFQKKREVSMQGAERQKSVSTKVLAGLFAENREIVESINGAHKATKTQSYLFGLYKETNTGTLNSDGSLHPEQQARRSYLFGLFKEGGKNEICPKPEKSLLAQPGQKVPQPVRKM